MHRCCGLAVLGPLDAPYSSTCAKIFTRVLCKYCELENMLAIIFEASLSEPSSCCLGVYVQQGFLFLI